MYGCQWFILYITKYRCKNFLNSALIIKRNVLLVCLFLRKIIKHIKILVTDTSRALLLAWEKANM